MGRGQHRSQSGLQIGKLEDEPCLQKTLGDRALAREQQGICHLAQSEAQHKRGSRQDSGAMQDPPGNSGEF